MKFMTKVSIFFGACLLVILLTFFIASGQRTKLRQAARRQNEARDATEEETEILVPILGGEIATSADLITHENQDGSFSHTFTFERCFELAVQLVMEALMLPPEMITGDILDADIVLDTLDHEIIDG